MLELLVIPVNISGITSPIKSKRPSIRIKKQHRWYIWYSTKIKIRTGCKIQVKKFKLKASQCHLIKIIQGLILRKAH